MVLCLERGADLHMAQLMPLPLTVSCFSEIQIGFIFLVPAHLVIVYHALVGQIFTTWHYMLFIRATKFFWHAISRKWLEIGMHFRGTKNMKLCLLSNGTIFNDLGWPTHKYTKFLLCVAMVARYILCDGPVFVRPSIWLGAEAPRDAKLCRGMCVTTLSSMRPNTDAQKWHGLSIHMAYCYWGYGRTTGWPTYRLCLAFHQLFYVTGSVVYWIFETVNTSSVHLGVYPFWKPLAPPNGQTESGRGHLTTYMERGNGGLESVKIWWR